MTQVCVSRYVDCPFSAALELTETAVTQRSGFYVTPSPPLGERVLFSAKSTNDSTDSARGHDALLIAWRPQTKGMFPDFRGVLTARPEHRGSKLRLTGQYEAPYGTAGKIFDFFIGRSIARSTVKHLLDDVAANVEQLYEQEKNARNHV